MYLSETCHNPFHVLYLNLCGCHHFSVPSAEAAVSDMAHMIARAADVSLLFSKQDNDKLSSDDALQSVLAVCKTI